MVLFDEIVVVCHLPQCHVFRQDASGFQIGNSFGRGGVLIDVVHVRNYYSGVIRSRWLAHLFLVWMSLRTSIGSGTERFQEEICGCFGIARRTQEKLERVPFRIDRSVEIGPRFFDFD